MDFKKKRLTVMVLAALTVTASANAAAAQDTARQVSVQKDVQKTAELSDEYALDDVTVTATKVEEKVKDVPASITVITAAEIKKRHVTSVREILQNETGIYMAPTAETKDGISLRGFGSKNILVLYNGQQVNTSFDGGIAWDTFPIEEIERIEIVRGASSSLYGGHAVAGVINIITKSGKGKPGEIKTNLVVSGGSNRTWNRSIRVSGSASEKFDFNVGYEKRSTGGYRGYYTTASGKPSGSAATTVDLPKLSDGTYIIGGRGRKDKQSENYFADFTYAMSPDKKLNFSYMHNTYRYNYLDAFTNAYDANGNGIFSGTVKTQEGTYVTLKPSSYLGYHGEREQDIYKLHYDDAKNKIKASIGISDITKEGYSSASSSANTINWSGAGSSAQYPSKNYSTDFQKTWEFKKHTLVSGLSWMKEEMTYSNYALSQWQNWGTSGNLLAASHGVAKSMAAFVQDEYRLADQWKVYLGARLDRYQKDEGYSYVSGSTRKDYSSKTFTEISPKISFAYLPNNHTQYYISYGHSFNPPTIYQLYRRAGDSMSSVQANPELNPETSNTFELGMKRKINDATSFEMTLFHVKTQDKIALATRDGIKAYYNMDSGVAKGIELGLKHRWDKNWSSYLNYTFESGENVSQGTTTRIWDIPKHLFHAGLDYTKGKVNWVLDSQYVSARQQPDTDTGEYGSEDAFFVVNTAINYKFDDQMSLQFDIKNILDRHYYAGEATNSRTYNFTIGYSF